MLPVFVVLFSALLGWFSSKYVAVESARQVKDQQEDTKRSVLLRTLSGGGFAEWAVIGITAGFAVATAMIALYDATFGSFSHYLALFLWAAGAGIGGNIFNNSWLHRCREAAKDKPLLAKAAAGDPGAISQTKENHVLHFNRIILDDVAVSVKIGTASKAGLK